MTIDSVPISSILDALEGVLTEAEREALFAQLIGLRPAGVAPGDLITAELFNQMLSDINGLMVRVAALEGASGGPVIIRIEPEGVDKEVSSLLTIVGNNFQPDDSDNTFVMVGTKKVTDFFPQSDEFKLLLSVPIGFAQLPITVPVTVTCDGKTSNPVSITIVPKVITPGGNITVEYQGAALGTIVAGQKYDLIWRVWSNLNVPSAFEVDPVVTAVSGGSSVPEWTAAITLPPGQFSLDPGGFHDVTMSVTVPLNSDKADINLHVESVVGNFVGVAQSPFKIDVGTATAVSDQRGTVALKQITTTPFRSGTIQVDQVPITGFKIQPNQSVDLPFQISAALDIGGPGNAQERSGEGHYVFTAEVESGPQNGRFTVKPMSSTRVFVAKNTTNSFTVPIQTAATPTDTTTVTWLKVTATCFTAANAGTQRFVSFTRIPLTGKS